MTLGIVGIKSGMTRIFGSDGESVPVTVVHADPNRVTQMKTADTDRYDAIQVTHGEADPEQLTKPMLGHFAKNDVSPGIRSHEFRLDGDAVEDSDRELSVGDAVSLDQFFEGQVVDVTGTSKGKGYAGVIKRWNFRSQDATHGNSLSHRAPGSVGQCQTPGKVFKGKKMSGHLGNTQVTVQNLKIVKLDAERNLLMIKGAVPGANGESVVVRPAVKKGLQQAPVEETGDDES